MITGDNILTACKVAQMTDIAQSIVICSLQNKKIDFKVIANNAQILYPIPTPNADNLTHLL